MKKLFVIVFTLVFFAANAQSPLCFGQPAGYVQPLLGSYPLGIIATDLNNDGIKDLATADMSGNSVCVRYGTGGGNFGLPYYFAVGSSPQQLCTGDFNSDGKVDIVATNYASSNISILFGATATSFSAPVNILVGTNPVNVLAADFNGDGKSDIAVCYSAFHLAVLINSGTGTFGFPVVYAAGNQPRDAVSGDFNTDGRTDLAVVCRATNNVVVFLGTPSGTFSPSVPYAVGSSPESIASADFNSDGKADLVTTDFNSNSVSVLFGSGTGTFANAVSFSTGNGPYGMDLGDFNGDSKTDIAVANLNGMDFSLLLSSTTGTFAFQTQFAITASPYFLAAADFNADGKMDLAAAHGASVTSVWFNSIPIPTITVSGGGICPGQSFSLSPSGALTYTFSSGTALVNPFTTTSYSVMGTNSAGCISTVAAVAVVTVQPFPTISVNSGTVCVGKSFTLMPTGAQTYVYSGGSAVVSPLVNTSYSISGISAFGCPSSNTVIANIVVNPLPVFTISGNYTVCAGQAIMQIANGPPLIYTWSNGVIGNPVNLYPTATTLYTVTGTDINNCSSSLTKLITVHLPPSLIVQASSLAVCQGGALSLTGLGAVYYSWSGGITNNTPFFPVNSGSYTLTGTDNIGCTNTKSIAITVYSLPVVVISVTTPTICIGQTVNLVASGAATYSWSTGEFSSSIITSPVATTQYSVTGTDANGCSNKSVFQLSVDVCLSLSSVTENPLLIKVYPNPNSGVFMLESVAGAEIKITNALGQVIKEEKINAGKNAIDLHIHPNGVYLIQLKSDQRYSSVRVLKN